MTVGQRFTEQGSPRVKFYDDVIERADEASFLLYPEPVRLTVASAVSQWSSGSSHSPTAEITRYYVFGRFERYLSLFRLSVL